jgi:UDP-GlcNAc:undecaprenyl-phosphate GlcNAc-1-phosphate transferase
MTVLSLIATFGVAAIASVVVTRAHIAIAPKVGLVAPPDPWHEVRPAQSGGLAMIAVVIAGAVALGLLEDGLVVRVLVATVALTIVGFVDDRRPLQPTAKLILQVVVSVALLASTFGDHPRVHLALTLPLTVVWLVGQSNAVNLLDNMDGCGPMVLTVSGLATAALQFMVGSESLATLAALIAGTSAGFFWLNRRPARVFMGDTGSLSLGFALAAIAVNGSWLGEGARLSRTFLPPLVMLLPLFNTAFVVITRFDAGVPVSRGLADHINYRLVGHGMSIGRALATLAGLGLVGGLVAIAWWWVPLPVWGALTALLGLGLAYFAVFLSHADVNEFYRRLGISLPAPRTAEYRIARRRAFELLTDVIVASTAYFFAFQLRFEGMVPAEQEKHLLGGLPVAVVACLTTVWGTGLYRSFWKYVGLEELIRIVKACAILGTAMFGVRLLPGFDDYPRSICILFPLLFGVLAASYRVSLRLMHEARQRAKGLSTRKKALIVGAGDAGVLALREMRAETSTLWPIGFIDDDPAKLGREIHGLAVLGSTEVVDRIAAAIGAPVVVIAMPSARREKIEAVTRACNRRGVEVQVFKAGLFPSRAEAPVLPTPQPESLPSHS